MLLTMWSMCLLAAFAVILGYTVRQKLSLVQRLDERRKLVLIRQAGIQKAARQIILATANANYQSLRDSWCNNSAEFKGLEVGDGVCQIGQELIDNISGGPLMWYGAVDEERKINLNKADREVLERLFSYALGPGSGSDAAQLAAAIVDWRDADSQECVPTEGAEDDYYRHLPAPYEAGDRDLEVLDELRLIKGVTECAYIKIIDYVTIYGSGQVNVNTAPLFVLYALGLPENLADKLASLRAGPDNSDGTADDVTFETVGAAGERMQAEYNLSDLQREQIDALLGEQCAVSSQNFMIRACASLKKNKDTSATMRHPKDSKHTAVTKCVMDKKARVKYWREQ